MTSSRTATGSRPRCRAPISRTSSARRSYAWPRSGSGGGKASDGITRISLQRRRKQRRQMTRQHHRERQHGIQSLSTRASMAPSPPTLGKTTRPRPGARRSARGGLRGHTEQPYPQMTSAPTNSSGLPSGISYHGWTRRCTSYIRYARTASATSLTRLRMLSLTRARGAGRGNFAGDGVPGSSRRRVLKLPQNQQGMMALMTRRKMGRRDYPAGMEDGHHPPAPKPTTPSTPGSAPATRPPASSPATRRRTAKTPPRQITSHSPPPRGGPGAPDTASASATGATSSGQRPSPDSRRTSSPARPDAAPTSLARAWSCVASRRLPPRSAAPSRRPSIGLSPSRSPRCHTMASHQRMKSDLTRPPRRRLSSDSAGTSSPANPRSNPPPRLPPAPDRRPRSPPSLDPARDPVSHPPAAPLRDPAPARAPPPASTSAPWPRASAPPAASRAGRTSSDTWTSCTAGSASRPSRSWTRTATRRSSAPCTWTASSRPSCREGAGAGRTSCRGRGTGIGVREGLTRPVLEEEGLSLQATRVASIESSGHTVGGSLHNRIVNFYSRMSNGYQPRSNPCGVYTTSYQAMYSNSMLLKQKKPSQI